MNGCPGCAARDFAQSMLIEREAVLLERIDLLLDLLARLGVEGFELRRVTEQEICARIEAEGRLSLTRRALYRLRDVQTVLVVEASS
jgi:hypothetical protein